MLGKHVSSAWLGADICGGWPGYRGYSRVKGVEKGDLRLYRSMEKDSQVINQ